jgi:hypothetical protein
MWRADNNFSRMPNSASHKSHEGPGIIFLVRAIVSDGTPNDDLNLRQLGASVIQVLRRP